jgi:hypothetical protein
MDGGENGPPWAPEMLMGEVGVTVKDGLGAGWATAVRPKEPLNAVRHKVTQTKPIWFLLVRRNADAPQAESPDDSTMFNDFPSTWDQAARSRMAQVCSTLSASESGW